MRLNVLILFLQLYICKIQAQTYTTWPLNHVKLTGNYGELRPNHFHAGLDFSSEMGENQAIFAVKSGYISRIKVSPYGYGKVIYLSHYDGNISVYAHQSRFNDSLENYVKREQYKQMSYEVELFPDINDIIIKEGELIGFMGNTGGSTGPHLHFEIRDEITEIPINPLLVYKLVDTIKPVCNGIAIYNLNDSLNPYLLKTIKVKNKKDSLFFEKDTIQLNNSIIGLAYSGFDCEVPKGNQNTIYDTKLFLDSVLVYHHQLNYLSFDYANYINEYASEINQQKFQKCFVPEIYPYDLFKTINSKGRIELKDTLIHEFKLVFTDEWGTFNTLKFHVKTKQINPYKTITSTANFYNCRKNYVYSTKTNTITLPPKSVYNHGEVRLQDKFETTYSINFSIPNTTMRSAGNWQFVIPEKWLSLSQKVVVKNNTSTLIPKVNGAVANCNFKQFGKLELTIDTVAPKIKPQLPIKKLKAGLKKADHISFKISDSLSGVGKYFVYVNDKWVIAAYDAKSDMLTYTFDSSTPTGELNIIVSVEDKTGNISTLKLNLVR